MTILGPTSGCSKIVFTPVHISQPYWHHLVSLPPYRCHYDLSHYWMLQCSLPHVPISQPLAPFRQSAVLPISISYNYLIAVLSWVTFGDMWWICIYTIALEISWVFHVIAHYHHLWSSKARIILDDGIPAHLRSLHTSIILDIICSDFYILEHSMLCHVIIGCQQKSWW